MRSAVGRCALACLLFVLVGCAASRGKGDAPGSAESVGAAAAPGATSAAETDAGQKAPPPAAGGGGGADGVPVKGDVIAVTVVAASDLNTFNDQPHTLVLALYQVSQSSAFTQFLDTPEGRARLLEGESFDSSVLARRRVVVQPGQTQVVVMDRVEGSRYLAAAAGFYDAQPRDMGRLIPVAAQTSGVWPLKKPKPILVRLSLGRSSFAP